MRTSTALAALFCTGLATSPAFASSTTIIDFTIELTSDRFEDEDGHPLLAGKHLGDQFDGFLALADPPVNVQSYESPLFPLETLTVEGFNPVFFANPVSLLASFTGFSIGERVFGEISSEVMAGDVFVDIIIQSEFVLPNELSDFGPSELLLILTSPGSKTFGVTNRDFIPGTDAFDFDGIGFEVISATVRPDTTPIPLPAAGWLMVAGLGGLAALRRRG